ncbi:MAG: AfsR/SARP family transcriptional regulator [Bacteroidales bacterium]
MLLKKLPFCFFLTWIPLSTLFAREVKRENVTILPEVFFKDDRFSYYEDKVYLDFILGLPTGTTGMTPVLLSGQTTQDKAFFLMLDADMASGELCLFLGKEMQMQKAVLYADSTMLSKRALPVSLVLDMKKDRMLCSFTPGDTVVFQPVGLSVTDRYKFKFHLPVSKQAQSAYPRDEMRAEQLRIAAYPETEKNSSFYWYVLIVLVDVAVFILMYCRHRKKRKLKTEGFDVPLVPAPAVSRPNLPHQGAIYLFGGMRIYNKQGEDISKRFSPILKELLSLLIVHSDKKGISAEKMKSYLWQDKTVASARNNRAVNLGKLRNLLSEVGNFEIKGDDGYWRIDSDDVFIDYLTCRAVMKKPGVASRSEIELLCALTREGNLLPEQEYEWLDALRGTVSDDLFDKFIAFADSLDEKESAETTISIADVMFNFESINEQALALKCRAYYKTGRHSAAKIFYDKFCEEYRVVYGEEFRTSFPEVLKSNIQTVF